MKTLIRLGVKKNVDLSIQKGYRLRFVAKNKITGEKFAPVIWKPWQFKAAIANAENWRPPT